MNDYDLQFLEDMNREMFILDEIEVKSEEVPAAEEVIRTLTVLGVGY